MENLKKVNNKSINNKYQNTGTDLQIISIDDVKNRGFPITPLSLKILFVKAWIFR